ncbi:glucose-6-phosphate isomerase [Thermovibrio sp.]
MEFNFSESGFSEDQLLKEVEKIGGEGLVKKEEMPFIELPTSKELKAVEETANLLRGESEKLVVVGMGGSINGTIALHQALRWNSKELLFIDNIDPELVENVLEEGGKTASFAFISKSGKTLETVSIMNLVFQRLKKEGISISRRCVFIGDSGNPFEGIARETGAPFLSIPKEVGGRFSALTAVGLLPGAFAGYNLKGLLEGARRAVESPKKALLLAAFKYLSYREGKRIAVMMPYSSYLLGFINWYVQLWSESLGKEGKGQTPLGAVGTSSQHSLLQLFLDGPEDKLYQLVRIKKFRKNEEIKEGLILDYVKGKRISQVINAEFEGTFKALVSKKRPVVVVELEELNEEEMGQLFMSYMIATVAMGRLMGVNPYGQRAVELGKQITREILKGGRDGESLQRGRTFKDK